MKGIFQITGWDETPYLENADGSKQSLAKVTQNYSGSIEGSSVIHYLMAYESKHLAIFVGFETITASIEGKQGTFILQHKGKFENGIASSIFSVIPNSGTGDLSNIEGSGSFTSGAGGQANYDLSINV